MLKHKSFVFNTKKNTPIKAYPKPIIERPIIVDNNEKKEVISGHYDINNPISLTLPESLSQDQDVMYIDNTSDPVEQTDNISQPFAIDEEPHYSEANIYFAKEKEEIKYQDIEKQIGSKEVVKAIDDGKITDSLKELKTNENKNIKEEGKKELDDILVLENEQDIIEKKKFEEEIKAIIEDKKVFDKEKIKRDPTEIIKNQNQGLIGKDDGQKLEDKLKNEHAIFDKIAQSMEMASTYDLGTIEMEKKFDNFEEETDKDFTKKIHNLLDEEKKRKVVEKEIKDDKEEIEDKETPSYINKKDGKDDKLIDKDFLKDFDKINVIESKDKDLSSNDVLSKQSSFNSTISIKHRYLKSRVFSVSGSTVQVTIDSAWVPPGCSALTDLNVTLVKQINFWPDSEKGTKKFQIGRSVTNTWSDLESGDYYLILFFVSNTNPYCELIGTINVVA